MESLTRSFSHIIEACRINMDRQVDRMTLDLDLDQLVVHVVAGRNWTVVSQDRYETVAVGHGVYIPPRYAGVSTK